MIGIELDSNKKTKTIGARVTVEQKKAVLKKMEETGFTKESEYVLYCCLNGNKGIKLQSPYQIAKRINRNSERLEVRVTADEKKEIIKRYELSNINNFSRFIRNCCMDKQIIVIQELKDFTKELHKIGNNLNQLTMLCHQGLISTPDIAQTSEYLKKIYKELVTLGTKYRLGR